MSDEVVVSVIIPNYNHARYLSQRIDSVLLQTYQHFEVIILDDCSTDASREVIESYRSQPRVSQIVYNEQNTGSPFRQWERGIQLAKGRYIWLAESDDYAAPAFLETLIGLTQRYPNVGIAFCGSYWVSDTGQEGKDLSVYQESFFREGPEEVKQVLSRSCSIQNASSSIVRRELAAQAVANLGQYRACGDWIFYIRVLQQSNLVFTGQKLNSFRWYHSNTSNSASKNGVWLTEGIKVLRAIDYRKVRFSPREFYDLLQFWRGKAKYMKLEKEAHLNQNVTKALIKYAWDNVTSL